MLDGHRVVVAPDLMTWGQWFETADRVVARTAVGDAEVSTVFIGLDHNWADHGPPLVFETMIFGGPEDGYCHRYATWDDAATGHAVAVEMAKMVGVIDK